MMRSSSLRVWHWFLGLGVLVCMGFLTTTAVARPPIPQPRSIQVYPDQTLPLRFSHRRHLESGVQCILCHGSVVDSETVLDRNLPDHAQCGICHIMDAPQAAQLFPKSDCATCHEGYEEGRVEHLGADRMPLPTAPPPPQLDFPHANLKFSHRLHVDQGAVCLDCHESVVGVDLATRAQLPDMGTCLGCHDGARAPSDCRTCHLQDDSGALNTEIGTGSGLRPRGRFRPDNHFSAFWVGEHGTAAQLTPEACTACHAPSQCLDCHDGTTKPLDLHPSDWIMSHGLEANRRRLDCAACHDTENFCQDCHRQAQVVPGAFPGLGGDPVGSKQFHPEGWRGDLGEIPGPTHHSHEARRSLMGCVSCHTEDQCVECHSFVNPHPRSWAEPGAAGKFVVGDGSVCLKCHSPGDPLLGGVGP